MILEMPPSLDQDASTSQLLAANVRRLRLARGLSQQKVATLASVPRPTWANLESGDANPTLTVLTKVASALCVGVEDLLLTPQAGVQLFRAEGLPSTRRGKSTIRSLTPVALTPLNLRRLLLPPGAHFSERASPIGVQAVITCEIGELDVELDDAAHRLRSGDVMIFKSDREQVFRNRGRGRVVAYAAAMPASVR